MATRKNTPAAAKASILSNKPPRARSGGSRSGGSIIPYLTVRDAQASRSFYEQAFGFRTGATLNSPQGELIQVVMHYKRSGTIKFSPEGLCSGSMQAPVSSGAENPITMYVLCADVDALTDRARAAGATILTEPADMFWGDRIARIADPDGYVWCFATKVGEFDAGKMPQAPEVSQDKPATMEVDLEF